MACLNPLKLLSRKGTYRQGDKLYNIVPCGKCINCVKSKADAWYVRAAYEYLRVKEIGGCVLFPTFSFNESSLPRLDTSESRFNDLCDELTESRDDGVTVDIPYLNDYGFDKHAMCDVFKRLHQYLRQGKSCVIPHSFPDKFKYFVTSEFGDNTKRPHNHCLLFLDFNVENRHIDRFCDILQLCWAKRQSYSVLPKELLSYLKNYRESVLQMLLLSNGVIYTKNFFPHSFKWACDYMILPPRAGQKKFQIFKLNGFVSWPKKDGVFDGYVRSVSACRYVSKYITKSNLIEVNPSVSILKSWLNEFVPRPYEGEFSDVVRELKNFLPFTISSPLFGVGLEDEIKAAYEKGDIKSIFEHPVSIPSDTTPHAVPSYIIQRLFYQNRHYVDFPEQTYRYLTPIGLALTKARFEYDVKRLMHEFNLYFKTAYLYIFPDNDLFNRLRSELELLPIDFNLKTLAYYKICLHNIESDFFVNRGCLLNSIASVEEGASIWLKDAVSNVEGLVFSPQPPCDLSYSELRFLKVGLCNHIPFLRKYCMLYEFYEKLKIACDSYISTLNFDADERKRILRVKLGLTF